MLLAPWALVRCCMAHCRPWRGRVSWRYPSWPCPLAPMTRQWSAQAAGTASAPWPWPSAPLCRIQTPLAASQAACHLTLHPRSPAAAQAPCTAPCLPPAPYPPPPSPARPPHPQPPP
ncbi:hypothetical protein V8C86DRAFT_2945069 [Haematococcus lacustris]